MLSIVVPTNPFPCPCPCGCVCPVDSISAKRMSLRSVEATLRDDDDAAALAPAPGAAAAISERVATSLVGRPGPEEG